jgi:hypothetical protein
MRDSALSEAMQRHTTTILAEMARRFDRLDGQNDSLAADVRFARGFAVQTFAASLESPPPSDKRVAELPSMVTGELSVGALCMLHEALLLDSHDADEVGQLRSINIWLGSPSATPDRATYVPPDAGDVPTLMAALVADWNGALSALALKGKPEVLNEITRFHHRFLKIHLSGMETGASPGFSWFSKCERYWASVVRS